MVGGASSTLLITIITDAVDVLPIKSVTLHVTLSSFCP